MNSMGRRSFLLSLGAAAGGAAIVRRLQPWRVLVAVDDAAPPARLARLFREPESAATVGRWYLEHLDGNPTADHLTAAITAVLPGGPKVLGASDDALRHAVAQRVQHEFATGDVVHLDGWVVSVTESRLCALCALAYPDR